MPSATPKRKGNRNVINFRNNGTSEWNDVIHEEIFDLKNNNYVFIIEPNTNFWRFGLRLFNSIEIPFSPNSRHDERNFDIQLAVGTWYKPENRWENGNRIEFGQYNIKSIDHVIDRFDGYKSLTKVEFSVGRDSDDILNVVYKTGQHRISRNIMLSSELRYFKIFAWADMIDFDLDCAIKVKSKRPVIQTTKKTDSKNYWFLKLSPDSWNVNNLIMGAETWFGTHLPKTGERRPEYDLFISMKENDLALGYAVANHESAVCIFRVTESVHEDKGKGEIVSLIVQEQLSPYIHQRAFVGLVNFANELGADSIRRLFSISKSLFEQILESAKSVISIRTYYDPSYAPEGDYDDTEDQLQFTNDIESFATVISMSDLEPPLAIGLFGNWGSGKSFFMDKLSKQIAENCSSANAKYAKNIVQVKFNSWHYSDSNLWASLTNQIFESLNDFAIKKNYGTQKIKEIFQKLEITNLQIGETQKQIDIAVTQVQKINEQKREIEVVLEDKKETLKLWKAQDLVPIVLNDPYIKADFDSIKDQFRDEKFIENISELNQRFSEVRGFINKLFMSFEMLRKNSKGNWWIIWAIFGVLFIVIVLLMGPFKFTIDRTARGFTQISSLVVILTGSIVKLYPYFRKLAMFYNRLASLKETIEREKRVVKSKEQDEINRLSLEIGDLNGKKELLEKEMSNKVLESDELRSQLSDIGSGRRLASFLLGKSNDDNYLNQLGIISWIRKDFSILNDLFVQQGEARKGEKQQMLANDEVRIDRIVLYIDDLDRCNEEIVVKVLEAIHLLLAFPLFVVIVGVDPRWLDNALNEKYKTLFGKKNNDNAKKLVDDKEDDYKFIVHHEPTSSYDYLEKIFQIPFSLKPINKEGREDLLTHLVRNEMEDSQEKEIKSVSSDESAQSAQNNDAGNSKRDSPSSDSKQNESPAEIKNARLSFSLEELKFMQEISGIFGHTPRTINRYVNIYRIIKAHKSFNIQGILTEGEFRATMMGVAIIVGHPRYAEKFIKDIYASKDNSMDTFLKGKHLPKFLIEIIRSNVRKQVLDSITPSMIQKNLDLISRFSFRPIQLDE